MGSDDVSRTRQQLVEAEQVALASTEPVSDTPPVPAGGVARAIVAHAEAERQSAESRADDLNAQVEAYRRSRGFYFVAIAILGIVLIIIVGGGLAAIFTGDSIPAWMVGLAGTALGAIAGLFAPSPLGHQ